MVKLLHNKVTFPDVLNMLDISVFEHLHRILLAGFFLSILVNN